jgi:hypothetical protein
LVLGIHVICTFHTWFINVSSTGVESGPFFCSKQKMGRGPPAHAPAVCPRSRDSAVPLPKSAAAITLAHRFRFHPTSLCAEASHRIFFLSATIGRVEEIALADDGCANCAPSQIAGLRRPQGLNKVTEGYSAGYCIRTGIRMDTLGYAYLEVSLFFRN